jgi:hypothetical protein
LYVDPPKRASVFGRGFFLGARCTQVLLNLDERPKL